MRTWRSPIQAIHAISIARAAHGMRAVKSSSCAESRTRRLGELIAFSPMPRPSGCEEPRHVVAKLRAVARERAPAPLAPRLAANFGPSGDECVVQRATAVLGDHRAPPTRSSVARARPRALRPVCAGRRPAGSRGACPGRRDAGDAWPANDARARRASSPTPFRRSGLVQATGKLGRRGKVRCRLASAAEAWQTTGRKPRRTPREVGGRDRRCATAWRRRFARRRSTRGRWLVQRRTRSTPAPSSCRAMEERRAPPASVEMRRFRRRVERMLTATAGVRRRSLEPSDLARARGRSARRTTRDAVEEPWNRRGCRPPRRLADGPEHVGAHREHLSLRRRSSCAGERYHAQEDGVPREGSTRPRRKNGHL